MTLRRIKEHTERRFLVNGNRAPSEFRAVLAKEISGALPYLVMPM
jgi:hypothetical protein